MSAGLGTLVLTVALDNSTTSCATTRRMETGTIFGFEGMNCGYKEIYLEILV